MPLWWTTALQGGTLSAKPPLERERVKKGERGEFRERGRERGRGSERLGRPPPARCGPVTLPTPPESAAFSQPGISRSNAQAFWLVRVPALVLVLVQVLVLTLVLVLVNLLVLVLEVCVAGSESGELVQVLAHTI